MRRTIILVGFSMALVTVFGLSTAHAVVPDLIPVQGVLTDADGDPLDGAFDIVFALYDGSDTGAVLEWSETRDGANQVQVADGFFTVYLGDVTSLDFDDLIDLDELWLGITVESDDEMDRVQLASVPFALEAATCRQIGSLVEADIATQGWVSSQTYASETWVTTQDYATTSYVDSAVADMATQTWVAAQGYETDNAATLCTGSEYLSGAGACDTPLLDCSECETHNDGLYLSRAGDSVTSINDSWTFSNTSTVGGEVIRVVSRDEGIESVVTDPVTTSWALRGEVDDDGVSATTGTLYSVYAETTNSNLNRTGSVYGVGGFASSGVTSNAGSDAIGGSFAAWNEGDGDVYGARFWAAGYAAGNIYGVYSQVQSTGTGNAWAGYFVGDVTTTQTMRADSYGYTNWKTGYFQITPYMMISRYDDYDYSMSRSDGLYSGTQMTEYFAQVNLPDGVTIASLSQTAWDNGTDLVQTAFRRRQPNSTGNSGTYEEIVWISSINSPDNNTASNSTIAPGTAVVDNENYQYFVYLYLGWNAANQCRFHGARITYQYLTVTP